MMTHGGLARFFACRDGVENWYEVMEYEVMDLEDIKMAEWLSRDEIRWADGRTKE